MGGHKLLINVFLLFIARLQNLPFTITSLSLLKAVWLSENQSQPMPHFSTDYVLSEPVLTCYLLPQLNSDSSQQNQRKKVEMFIIKLLFSSYQLFIGIYGHGMIIHGYFLLSPLHNIHFMLLFLLLLLPQQTPFATSIIFNTNSKSNLILFLSILLFFLFLSPSTHVAPFLRKMFPSTVIEIPLSECSCYVPQNVFIQSIFQI